MILASIPQILLLTLLLLWRSRAQRRPTVEHGASPSSGAETAGRLQILGDWTIDVAWLELDLDTGTAAEWGVRSLLGGLSAGVGLGGESPAQLELSMATLPQTPGRHILPPSAVILPRSPVTSTCILLLAWGLQGLARERLTGLPAAATRGTNALDSVQHWCSS